MVIKPKRQGWGRLTRLLKDPAVLRKLAAPTQSWQEMGDLP